MEGSPQINGHYPYPPGSTFRGYNQALIPQSPGFINNSLRNNSRQMPLPPIPQGTDEDADYQGDTAQEYSHFKELVINFSIHKFLLLMASIAGASLIVIGFTCYVYQLVEFRNALNRISDGHEQLVDCFAHFWLLIDFILSLVLIWEIIGLVLVTLITSVVFIAACQSERMIAEKGNHILTMVQARDESSVRADFVVEESRNMYSNKVVKWQDRVFRAGQLSKIYSLISACTIVVALAILLTIDMHQRSYREESHEYLFSVEINLKSHAVESYFLMFITVLLFRAVVYYLSGSLISKSKLKCSVLVEWWISLTIVFMGLQTVSFMMVHDYFPEAQSLLIAFYILDMIVQICLIFVGLGFIVACRKYEKFTVQDFHVLEPQNLSSDV